MSRMSRLVAHGLRTVRVMLFLSTIALLACTSSSTAGGTVDGVRYNLGAARTLRIPPAALAPYGSATDLSYAEWFVDPTAYSVARADPDVVLVLRLKPGIKDDAGSLGEWMVLTRGNDAESLICDYFDAALGPIPSDCG